MINRVSGRWLSSLKDFQTRMNLFKKKHTLAAYSDPTFNIDLLRVDSVLDVDLEDVTYRYMLKKTADELVESKKVNQVLVKWSLFTHETSTWEYLDSLEDISTRYTDFFTYLAEVTKVPIADLYKIYTDNVNVALNHYVAGLDLCKLASKQVTAPRKFKEYLTQPSSTKNGTLKDYQLEGLK